MNIAIIAGEEELGQQRRCTRCGEWWPDDPDFYYERQSWCRACWADRSAARYAAQLAHNRIVYAVRMASETDEERAARRERRRAVRRAWYAENRARITEYHRDYRHRRRADAA